MPKLTPGIESFPALIRDLNKILEGIDERLTQTPKLNKHGDLDLQGKRIMRVGKTKERSDVPGRLELEQKGLFETPDGTHVANSDLVVSGGIRSTRRAKEPDELVPLRQVQQMVAGGTSGTAVVTSNVDQSIQGHKLFSSLGTIRNNITVVNGVNHNVSINPYVSGPGGGLIYFTGPSGVYSITGIRNSLSQPGGQNGQVIILFNPTGVNMTLVHNSSSSLDANRMYFANNSNVVVGPKGSMMLIYVDLIAKWVNVSRV